MSLFIPTTAERENSFPRKRSILLLLPPFFAQASQQDVSFPEGKVKATANESANLKFPCRFHRLKTVRRRQCVDPCVHHIPDHKESASILSFDQKTKKINSLSSPSIDWQNNSFQPDVPLLSSPSFATCLEMETGNQTVISHSHRLEIATKGSPSSNSFSLSSLAYRKTQESNG